MSRYLVCGTAWAALAYGAVATLPAQAQDATQPAASSRSDEMGDIVVTARRREERLQDVPIAVTALSGEALNTRGIISTTDLMKTTPGLNIASSNRGNSSPHVILRGQRVQDTSMVIDGPVLFYVNEVPWMRINGLNQALYDIDNVQVLRGPQGTQFGKSTTGGAILVNTARAKPGVFEGYVRGSLGSYDLKRLEGSINLPLSDTLAIRFAGTFGRRDGFVKVRTVPGLAMNNEHYDGQRISIGFDDGSITNDLVVSRFAGKSNGSANPVWIFNPAAPAAIAGFPSNTAAFTAFMQAAVARNRGDFYGILLDTNSTTGFRPGSREKTADITNTTTIKLSDNLSIKNIMAYRNIDAPFDNDLDGTNLFLPVNGAGVVTPGAYVAGQEFYSFTKVHQFSDELQLQGSSEAFDWTIGAFFLTEKGIDGTTSYQGGTPTTGRYSTVAGKNTSYSAFASGTYRFGGVEGLSISAGARISHDKRRGDQLQEWRILGNPTPQCQFRLTGVVTPVCAYRIETSLTKPSWSVSLNYKVDPDLLIYVAHRHGYRSGGVQNRATQQSIAIPFGAETINDIEIGLKLDKQIGSDASIVFNADAYRGWYSGLQRSVLFLAPGATTPVPAFVNAGKAVIQGIEAEATLRFGGFELAGNVGYTDAYYKEYTQQATPTVVQDLSFLDFGFVPKWTYQARAGYTLPLAHEEENINAQVMLQGVSKQFTAETPMPLGQYLPGYHTFDARLAWNKVMGSDLDLSVLVTNLTKEKYHNYAVNFTSNFGYSTRYPAPPRRFEVTANYRF